MGVFLKLLPLALAKDSSSFEAFENPMVASDVLDASFRDVMEFLEREALFFDPSASFITVSSYLYHSDVITI